jgi:glucose-1-phosphate adenylyltransferase
LLTQFNSASLHRHISGSYKFDHFSDGFVEILAAAQTSQTSADASWYEGTADAVRKNMIHFLNAKWDYLLILSGDQLYRMDFRDIIEQHAESGADITVATIPVERREVGGLGIMQVDAERRITRFVEKPKDPAVQDSLRLPREWYGRLGIKGEQEFFLASMGIYVFNREVISNLMDMPLTDFGKHVIPYAIQNLRVFSFVFQGYWEDIGTIRAFFDANLDLTSELPRFDFFNMEAPIFSRPRYLPSSKINGAQIDHAVISDGCILNHAIIKHSVVGLRSFVGAGTVLERVILLGCDYYETYESIVRHEKQGQPRIGIGINCQIKNTIVDKNARIGNNVNISPDGKPENVDAPNYYIRDGIVIIPKKAVIPHGTRI